MNQFASHLFLEDLHHLTEESIARFEALVFGLRGEMNEKREAIYGIHRVALDDGQTHIHDMKEETCYELAI